MKIYQIEDDNYVAKINLSRGANCFSLRNKKYHAQILREPDYTASLDNPYLYGMPILFPVNRISEGRFVFEERKYTFPINEPNTGCHLHGILHETEFQMVESGKNYLVASYKATKDKPYMQFPHEFEISISYRLSKEGLEQQTEITNLSAQNMPVMIGFHTTFQIPFMENQEADDLRIYSEVTDLIERNMDTYLPTGNIIRSDDVTEKLRCGEFRPWEQKISRHYKSGKDGIMIIRDVKRQLSIQYLNSSNMQFRLLYNGDANKYICLEPQNCMVNCLNEKIEQEYSGFEYLKPNETKIYTSKIYITQDVQ